MKTESMFGLAMLAAVAVVQVVGGAETVSERMGTIPAKHS